MSIRFVTLLVAPLVLALAGCPTKQDPLACQEACSHQEVKTFCDIDGVYPDSSLANECIAPPSTDACNRIETCTTAGKPYCTDESMGECVECLTSDQCADGEVCDSGSHACVVLACTPGTDGDASCVAADATRPFCGPSESCVACLVSADCASAAFAVCDPDDFECRGCVANGECDSKLCGTANGVCADAADILYVAIGGTGTNCTVAAPCGSIAAALALVTGSRDTILVGAGEYGTSLVLVNKTVRIVGEGAVNINPSLGIGDIAVSVTGTSDVTFEHIDIALEVGGSASSIALKCDTAANTSTVRFHDGTISGSAGSGVSANRCDLTVTGSTISRNAGGGIQVTNSDYSIINNFVAFNGSNAALVAAVTLSNDGNVQEFNFNTVVGSQVAVGTAGVECTAVIPMTATGNIVYSNTGGAAVDNTGCSWTYSDIQGGQAGTGNLDLDPLLINSSAVNGNYHLQSASPCINAADPAATLDTDIDGDIRPQGAARDMGADEAG